MYKSTVFEKSVILLKRKLIVSNPRDNSVQFFNQIGCALIMQMQGNIHTNVQMNSIFQGFAIQVEKEAIAF
jgi:hypothetical protein